jgi:flagellar biosynthesis/type III secretory pathway chaperone
MLTDRVETLCDVLDEETRLCGALAAVLNEEQRAVVALRPGAILACLEERQALHEELERLAARRRTLVHDAASEHGADATASATSLLPLLPPDPQARLRAQLRALRRALLEARSLERQNASLAGASLEALGEMLPALRALLPGVRYGADAQVDAPAAAERIDRRA